MRVIDDQIRTLTDSAEESWKRDHRDASLCHDVEMVIDLTLALWGVFTQPSTNGTADASDTLATLQNFNTLVAKVHGVADELTARGFQIRRLPELHEVREVIAMSLAASPDRLAESRRHAAARQTRSLGEVRRDLQRRVRP